VDVIATAKSMTSTSRSSKMPAARYLEIAESSSSLIPNALLTAEPMSSQKGQPTREAAFNWARSLRRVSAFELSNRAVS
jgi:hypothetical protein